MIYQNINALSKDTPILITGGTGLVGHALAEELTKNGFNKIYPLSSSECDLRDKDATLSLFNSIKPNYVFHLAARVHGLGGNSKYKDDILVDNLMINTNVIESSIKNNVKKIICMGSGCVYPELDYGLDLVETDIWKGPPHESEDSYGFAKRLMYAHLIAAKKQYNLNSCFVISGNLYGPYDKFNYNEGHVIPSLIRKFYEASKTEHKVVKVWGSGAAIRDFTFSVDAARALLYMFENNFEGPINLGSNIKASIADIVNILSKITGCSVQWDSSKPDGQLYRCYNTEKLSNLGFLPKYDLETGIRVTYKWFSENYGDIRE